MTLGNAEHLGGSNYQACTVTMRTYVACRVHVQAEVYTKFSLDFHDDELVAVVMASAWGTVGPGLWVRTRTIIINIECVVFYLLCFLSYERCPLSGLFRVRDIFTGGHVK